MTSDKKNISLLSEIFVKSGLKNIVLSPGSRNAPIVISFANRTEIDAYSIVDERSAAYFAIGLSLQSGRTTAIACTSGSAVLNYAPAIAEAYYQKVPLLVITADRPEHLVDIGDGQTIRQKNVFSNYIKSSYQLPLVVNDHNQTEVEELIASALSDCVFPEPGPVHINVPFDEPLYGTLEHTLSIEFRKKVIPEYKPDKVELRPMIEALLNSKRILIIAGQQKANNKLNDLLSSLSEFSNVVVLTETTSNLSGGNYIDTIDNVISTITPDEAIKFKPDMLISFGGQVVSKMIKKFLRHSPPDYHFHISSSGEKMDTYSVLTATLKADPALFLTKFKEILRKHPSDYSELWQQRKSETTIKRNKYIDEIEYSDLKVFDHILRSVPQNSIIHLGNSTPVRYSQLFGSRKDINYLSNRGVSGIDGQVSTALGFSQNSKQLNVLITGDLGFLYDSNGLMNHYLQNNLKIIVINNQGGGIFRFIPGPDTTPNLEKFFEVKHNWNAEHICKAYGVDYRSAEEKNYISVIEDFLNDSNNRTCLLEIFTPNEKNSEILRDYFKCLIK